MTMNKKTKSKKYSVAIIGAGRIAAGFDAPSSKQVLTHAHAILKNDAFVLVGMSDTDAKRGKKEAKKWGTVYFERTETMLAELIPDVVVIASPDETHKDLLLLAKWYSPKLIICEKPIVTLRGDMETLANEFGANAPEVIVNFSRRFDSATLSLRNALAKGKYGRVISASGVYTNGVLHNGSHMMDLARYLFGESRGVETFGSVPDRNMEEPSVAGFVTFENCPQFSLWTGDERAYALFELEIVTEKKRISLENFGGELVLQDVIPDPLYKGFKALGRRKVTKTKLADALSELYRHAKEVIEGRQTSRSGLASAIKTQEICFQLLGGI